MHTVDDCGTHGHDSVVSALIAAGASVDQAMETEHIVDVAAQNGHDSVVSALISAGASVDQVEEDRCTPLRLCYVLPTQKVTRM